MYRHVCANSAFVSQRVTAWNIVVRLFLKLSIFADALHWRNVQHAMAVIAFLVLCKLMHFSRRYSPERFSLLSVPATLTFDLVTYKLLCQLALTWVTSCESLNVVRCSVFELTVGTGQTDRRTDGLGVTRNAAFCGFRIISDMPQRVSVWKGHLRVLGAKVRSVA